MSTQQEVSEFLTDAFEMIRRNQWIFVERQVNLDELLRQGFTQSAAVADLVNLTVSDYCSGPEADRDRPQQSCWIFGYPISGQTLYVKLIIESLSNGRNRLKVLSYHQAARSLNFPYQGAAAA